MKVTVREPEDQTFEPFDLVIRVESKAELAALWLTLNVNFHTIREYNDGEYSQLEAARDADSNALFDIFGVLDEKWKERCK